MFLDFIILCSKGKGCKTVSWQNLSLQEIKTWLSGFKNNDQSMFMST